MADDSAPSRRGAPRRGNGPGWGGPAKGEGSKAPTRATRPPFEAGNTLGQAGSVGGDRAARRRQQADELLDRLHRIGLGQEPDFPPQVQVQAAVAFAAKVEPDRTQSETTFVIKTGVPRADRD